MSAVNYQREREREREVRNDPDDEKHVFKLHTRAHPAPLNAKKVQNKTQPQVLSDH